jgi:hypothetical protein
LSSKLCTEGLALSKTQSFMCFQIIQGVNRMMVASPLRIGFGRSLCASIHQLVRLALPLGAWYCSLSQDRTSCQTCREKGKTW